jgi:cell division protein ZapB
VREPHHEHQRADSSFQIAAHPYNVSGMSASTPNDPIDQLAERVERLLLRHEELLRTNALLADQVGALAQERDSLKSRLSAARARVDALLQRLPEAATQPAPMRDRA